MLALTAFYLSFVLVFSFLGSFCVGLVCVCRFLGGWLVGGLGVAEDYDTKHLIFEVSRERPPKFDLADLGAMDENSMRKIK